jgi:hypothetical protein
MPPGSRVSRRETFVLPRRGLCRPTTAASMSAIDLETSVAARQSSQGAFKYPPAVLQVDERDPTELRVWVPNVRPGGLTWCFALA